MEYNYGYKYLAFRRYGRYCNWLNRNKHYWILKVCNWHWMWRIHYTSSIQHIAL
ncbi:MAG: hypothetical protein FWG39_00195 [Alphaproteobacteria bacterium]|nr:hypothetical protein [Alphaproteobacteria bacterium]